MNGERVSEATDVARALRGVDASEASIAVDRAGVRRVFLVGSEPLRLESIEHGAVALGEVRADGALLRTILTIPRGEPPFPAILFVQGIDVGSLEHPLDPKHPVLRLVSSWTASGFLTMRVERSGVGDSEGPPPAACDLGAQIANIDAGLSALLANDLVDPTRVFVFGISLGGMIAPLAGGMARARGVAVFGTSARRWRACAVATTERQLALRGYRAEELDERVALWAEMHAAVCRDGLSPEEAMIQRPHLAVLASRECRADTMFGHSAALFRELERADVRAAWRSVACDVLVLHGEHDWVCDSEDAASVVDACGGRARFTKLARIGHDMRAHVSLEASYREPSRGAWEGTVALETIEWMRSFDQHRRPWRRAR